MSNESPKYNHDQILEQEVKGVQAFYNDLLTLNATPQDPSSLDSRVVRMAETYLEQAPANNDPTFSQVINALASGAMRTHNARSIAERVFSTQKHTNSIDHDVGNRFSSLLQGSIESRNYEGGAEALSYECAMIAQKWGPEVLNNTNLTQEQRRGMALTVLFASQAADIGAGISGVVGQNLPQFVDAIRGK